MRIVNANTLNAREVIYEMITKIGQPQTNGELKQWLMFNLGTEMFGVWLMYNDDQPNGVVAAEATKEGSAFISYIWTRPGLSETGLLEKVEIWAKKLGLKRMIKYTNKSPTTYIKKHGWSVWQTVLTKEL